MAKKQQAAAKRKRGTDDTYFGHSGQMAVMAELLFRKCNVSKPDIDEGTDVFAFREDRPEDVRIQVKSAKAKPYNKGEGYNATFDISMAQLRRQYDPPLYYALAANLHGKWDCFLVISHADMVSYWNGDKSFGTENPASGNLVLYIQYRERVLSQEVDLTGHKDAWSNLPPLKEKQPLSLPERGIEKADE